MKQFFASELQLTQFHILSIERVIMDELLSEWIDGCNVSAHRRLSLSKNFQCNKSQGPVEQNYFINAFYIDFEFPV
jgi:hypothetical protein